ncbi:MAG: DUF2281 domain-containing protein [Calditrichaeota bacterium]|nr:MAG: DUF2281 domain-containing protein [Calditrichota bacterium]
MGKLAQKIRELPPELQREVEDFVDFLSTKYIQNGNNKKKTFAFDWEGALADLRDQYTSVGLQHESLKWWGD